MSHTGVLPTEIKQLSEWLRKKEGLEDSLRDHLRSCKHWGLLNIREVTNINPQFPDKRIGTCAYCGKDVPA